LRGIAIKSETGKEKGALDHASEFSSASVRSKQEIDQTFHCWMIATDKKVKME
jgi:hypothetical protein